MTERGKSGHKASSGKTTTKKADKKTMGKEPAAEEATSERASSRLFIVTHLRSMFEEVTAAAEIGLPLVGISTGYNRIDALTGGLRSGELSVIASRPGMGKTALATCMAVNVASPREIPQEKPAKTPEAGKKEEEPSPATRPGGGVLIFSLGTPAKQLSARMVSAEGRVELGRLTSARMEPQDWRRITEAASYLSMLPMFIDDSPTHTVRTMTETLRSVQREYDNSDRRLELVVVDYIQLCEAESPRQNREEELAEISRGLKVMARSCGVHVMALSQLNRSLEIRQSANRRPQLWDLRGSGSIEDDADLLMFIYRDEFYYPDSTNRRYIADIDIAKHRNGPRTGCYLRFTDSYARFDNLAPGEFDADFS